MNRHHEAVRGRCAAVPKPRPGMRATLPEFVDALRAVLRLKPLYREGSPPERERFGNFRSGAAPHDGHRQTYETSSER